MLEPDARQAKDATSGNRMEGHVASATFKAKGAALLHAYLMVGEDELKQRTALERLEKRLAASGEAEFNQDVLDGASLSDAALLRSSLDTLPFASDFRLVIIKGVDKAPKATRDMLADYLASPNPTTVLAMTCAKMPKSTRLYKAVAKLDEKAVMDCAPKKRWELPPQVAGMARTRGKQMDPEAAELLVRLVGESTTMLDTEVRKLASTIGDRANITAADVEANVTRIAEVKPWDFLDAVCQRDPALAMRMLDEMPSQSPIGLFTLAVSRLRELIAAKALAERGTPGMLAQTLGMQSWQVKNHATWARNYTMAELLAALRGAATCDEALKSTPDKTRAIQRWVLSFCTPAPQRSRTTTSSGGQSTRRR